MGSSVSRMSFVLQSERSQLGACGLMIRGKNTSNPKACRDLNEHPHVFYGQYLAGWRLGDVHKEPLETLRISFGRADHTLRARVAPMSDSMRHGWVARLLRRGAGVAAVSGRT